MQKRIYLSSPTMHGEEQKYVQEAFDTNWVAPLGPNVNAFEKEMAEEFRYSDPVSSEALADIETELSACVDELQKAVVDGDSVSGRELCRKVSVTLTERNRLCKLNK